MPEQFPPELENHIGRRANARARMCLPAKLMFPDRACTCILENLSPGGALVHVESAPPLGSGVCLQCADFELFCTVVWTDGRKAGLSFDVPLNHDIVLAVRAFANNYANMSQVDMQREAIGRLDIGDSQDRQ